MDESKEFFLKEARKLARTAQDAIQEMQACLYEAKLAGASIKEIEEIESRLI